MEKIGYTVLSLYAMLILERMLVHFPRGSMNMDSLFYALSAIRFSEGNFLETLSGPWQPLTGWLAGVLVFLGLSAEMSVTILSALGGAVALLCVLQLANYYGGWRAAIIAGIGLASEPRFLNEAAAIRSDGFHVGVSLLLFLCLARYVIQSQKASLSTFGTIMLLVCTLICLRVAALPTVILASILVFFIQAPKRVRISGTVLYFVGLLTTLSLFCLFYYRRFGLFVPSLNFPLNSFLRIVEWMHVDPEGFCRLYDGHNTVISDLQLLDPTATTLPTVPTVSAEKIFDYRLNNFFQFFRIAIRCVSIPIWGGVALGTYSLWKEKKYRLLVFILVWLAFTCGAQALSTIQYRFFLPAVPLLYFLCGIGVSKYLPKKAQWISVGIVLLNIWCGRNDMNPGFLLSGKFINSPDLTGQHLYEKYGPGKTVAAVAHYPSLVAAKARWKTIPCIDTDGIVQYFREKKVDFLILQNPPSQHFGPAILNLLTRPGLLELEAETESEQLFRVLP